MNLEGALKIAEGTTTGDVYVRRAAVTTEDELALAARYPGAREIRLVVWTRPSLSEEAIPVLADEVKELQGIIERIEKDAFEVAGNNMERECDCTVCDGIRDLLATERIRSKP